MRTDPALMREPWRMSTALLLSLLVHALLLSLSFGDGLGLPGLDFPWKEKRFRADDLHVRLAPRVTPAPVQAPQTEPGTSALGERTVDAGPTADSLANPMEKTTAVSDVLAPAPATPSQVGGPDDGAPAPVSGQAPTPRPAPVMTAIVPSAASIVAVPSTSSLRLPDAAREQSSPEAEMPTPDDAGHDRIELEARERALELARIERAKEEAARESRRQAALLETAREIERKEAERQETARQLEAQQEQARQEQAQRARAQQETTRLEAARLAAAQTEAERLATARLELQRTEAERQEAVKQEAAKQDAAKREAIRIEAARLAAAQLESARQAAARQELERAEAARQETERQEAARAEAARQESARQERARQEQIQREKALQETARLEAARLAQLEAARQEAARLEKEKLEKERLEQAQREKAQQEAARQVAAQQELARAEAARLEAQRQEAARQEAARQERARQEQARQEQMQQEKAQQEAARIEAARQATAQQEAARQEAARQEKAKQETAQAEEAAREARLKAIGRQLDEEAAKRDAAARASGLSPNLLPVSGGQRRGRLFGRSDPNAELVLYGEAWDRKIQKNAPVEMVRDLAKQTYTRPLVTVAIRSDGSVEKITFVVSSGVTAIDEAIRQIVQSQALYPPFPPGLASQYDVIEIRRSWSFDTAIRMN